MKRQYGDSKDSFKWDYHDHLASALGVPRLTVALILTPDDNGRDGQTMAEAFPARSAVLRFCRALRPRRDIEGIRTLPAATGGGYQVALHRGDVRPSNRQDYFSGFDRNHDEIVFVDPNSGFEPEQSCQEKHVAYRDLSAILGQVSERSVVTVFHYFRRISFPLDFARIRERLNGCPSIAIHWHSLMFVALACTDDAIALVRNANRAYATNHPVGVID